MLCMHLRWCPSPIHEFDCRTEDDSCSLQIQEPCLFNDTLYTDVTAVKNMTFNVLPVSDYFEGYVGCPATNLVRTALDM